MMAEEISVKKILNNNVIIANHSEHNEVILIGKGIGFGKKAGDIIDAETAEKVFLLEDSSEQEKYKQLLPFVDEEFIPFMHDILYHIEQRMGSKLNQHIHIALTDHIAFAIRRLKEGLDFKNPFLIEIQTMYPKEYQVASEIVDLIKEKRGVQFPEGEIGFIALHIHSAVTDKKIGEVNKHSQLIHKLINMVEHALNIKLDRSSINYYRLVQHLRHAIDRVFANEPTKEQTRLAEVLKNEYPLCYDIAWKLVKVMQQTLKKPIDESEVVYLTIHIQRLTD